MTSCIRWAHVVISWLLDLLVHLPRRHFRQDVDRKKTQQIVSDPFPKAFPTKKQPPFLLRKNNSEVDQSAMYKQVSPGPTGRGGGFSVKSQDFHGKRGQGRKIQGWDDDPWGLHRYFWLSHQRVESSKNQWGVLTFILVWFSCVDADIDIVFVTDQGHKFVDPVTILGCRSSGIRACAPDSVWESFLKAGPRGFSGVPVEKGGSFTALCHPLKSQQDSKPGVLEGALPSR